MRLRQTQTDPAALAARLNDGIGLSSSRVLSSEGDDLNRSRYFSLKAGLEMTAIIDADRASEPNLDYNSDTLAQGRDPIWLCERLSVIQREAKRARARAIYRSAQDVLGLIQRCNVHMPIDWLRVDGRLFVLNKLLNQYEAGLSEIEITLDVDSAQDTAAASAAEPDFIGPVLDTPAEILSETQSDTFGDPAFKDAKQTLRALLPHASNDETAALSRLMDIDLTPAPMPVPVTVTEQAPAPASSDPALIIAADRIEWIMPGLMQRLFELGRQYGKIFSVSHSLDDVLIDAGSADRVQTRLFDQLSDVIASNLPLQGVGRLDISASDDALQISGSGFDTFSTPLTERVPDRVAETLDVLARNLDPNAVPTESLPTPPRPPMITADTEGELRAQLAALMDVGLADFSGTDQ